MKPMMVLSLFAFTVLQTNAHAKSVDLVLRLKERVSMESLANSVLNPASPRYQMYYSPEEIRALAAPTDEDYQNLLSALESQGMKVIHESPSHLLVTVRTETAQVERVFATKLNVVGEKLAGVTHALTIPSELNLVASVTGLDQTHKLRPHLRHASATAGDGSFVTQAQIKSAYGFKPIYAAGYTGKGQHIAIATYDGFHLSDVTGFFKESKITPAPQVDQVTFNGTPAVNEDSAAETELDSEFSGMIAPGSKIHVFASAENSDAGELAMFTAILDDGRAQILNYSWGSCEANTDAKHRADMDKLYARAVAQGVNIMIASGDSGSDGCRAGDGTNNPDWPASSPNVVAVGGTSFKTVGGKIAETAWSDSGGGISTVYKLPHFQETFQSPYVKRSFPDVAFNADLNTGEQIWTQYETGKPHWMTIGGTSMAAPQWSGFLALVGEARAKAGKKTLGYLNPIIYSMSGSTKAKVLHDVTEGNNGYAAGPGWDAVTGWGSPQADELLKVLLAH